MKHDRNKKKTIGTIAGLVVGIITIFLIQQFLFKESSFDKAMMEAASELNKSCPVMVDQETRLDNVIALPDNVFQYNYTLISIDKESIDLQAFNDYMQPMILNNVKTNPDLKTYRDNKVTMAYSYKDKNGVFITKISVTADQYFE